MKKILSFLVIILTISHVGFSRTRDINEMKQIAAIALKQQYGAEKFNGAATPDFTVLKETANYCLLTNNSVGTVIVAKNDLYGPVLGCSTSPCDLNNLPCGFKWWLEAIDGSLSGNLKAKRVPVPNSYPQNVDPLVQVNWGQQSPFNNMCPNGCLVGCVAVAMGQIMSAYRCPNVGNGSYSYNLGGQVLSVNFGESNYDWDMIMGGDYNEIAKLLFHCGVAVRTNYGTSVSTAFMPEIRSALINYFRYTNDAAHKYRSNYSDDEWFNMIYRNLANGHPIAYSGDNSESYSSVGHAFVVDGYNNNGEMHINWGWNGNMDGFFDLSSINYSYNQDMVCDIMPSAYQPSAKPYLTLDMGGDGVVKLIADEGSSYEFIIEVEDNWMLDKVYFNSQDVTGALNDNTYTTPAINQNATIRVVAHDTTPQPIFGDVNDDGEVNIADVNAVIDAIISNRVVERADVNSDGEINIADVNVVLNIILGAQTQQNHEYVDLGLPSGTLWATCNIGANSPEDYGDYFAWGETAPKHEYTQQNYEWYDYSRYIFTKYCTYSMYGIVDHKKELDPEDDAAYVNWGPSWRMPTLEQIQELIDNCSWKWTLRNGEFGQLVTGPNGNTLFLPTTGMNNSSIINADWLGVIWSRTLFIEPHSGYVLEYHGGGLQVYNDHRSWGCTVRAVRAPQN